MVLCRGARSLHKIKSRMASATVRSAVVGNRGMMPDGLAFSVTCRRGIREALLFVHFLFLLPLLLFCLSDDTTFSVSVDHRQITIFLYRFSLSLSHLDHNLCLFLLSFHVSRVCYRICFCISEKERERERGRKSFSALFCGKKKPSRFYIFYTTQNVSNAMCREI